MRPELTASTRRNAATNGAGIATRLNSNQKIYSAEIITESHGYL
jgi:hypothetical protein